MTTIAYRDGIIAADTSVYGNVAFGGTIRKICKNATTLTLAGFAGRIAWGTYFLEEIELADNPRNDADLWMPPDCLGMLIDRGSPILLISEGMQIPILDEFYAIGTGAGFAMAAMKSGANAIDAIKIAAEMDPWTKEPFTWATNRVTNNIMDIKTGKPVAKRRRKRPNDDSAS